MSRLKLRALFCVALLILAGAANAGKPLPLSFFASLDAHHPFWALMRHFEEDVGADLGVESRWYFADSNQILGAQQIRAEAQTPVPMRGAVITDFKGQGANYLKLVNDLKVPAISFVGFDLNKLGKPRQQNPYWIGAISMDEEAIGYQLAQLLFSEAERLGLKGQDDKIHVVGISGDINSSLAQARENGLRRAVKDRAGRVVLEQMVPTYDWSEKEGYAKALGLLRRYPQVSVVWSANDAMAVGVVKAFQKLGKKPGRDRLTGGIDWTPEALKMVAKGDMVCSIGGLGFQAGWAAILLYDYLNGNDFSGDVGTVIHIPSATLTQANAARFLQRYGSGDWSRINFAKLSKTLNTKLVHYDFSITAILELEADR